MVAGVGPYQWTGPGLVADVQAWLDDPATNFGWLIKGNEFNFPTTKRFDTRENAPGVRPTLTVEFATVGVPIGPAGRLALRAAGSNPFRPPGAIELVVPHAGPVALCLW